VKLTDSEERIGKRLRHGGSLAQVEREIIEPSALDENQKAGLRLYAFLVEPNLEPRPEVERLVALRTTKATV
jgi:hypothetical protein